MTLTAITPELELFNPSAMIAGGIPQSDVFEEMRDVQAVGLFCPHCYRKSGQMLPVRFRSGGDARRPHFYHMRDTASSARCENYHGESDKHLNAKTFLGEVLRCNEAIALVEVDQVFIPTPDGRKRKPDVLATYVVGTREAHEIQISPINSAELDRRTADLIDGGCDRVVWYLYGGNYNSENRQWCVNKGCRFYRLQFTEGGIPEWMQGSAPEPSKGRSSAAVDGCRDTARERRSKVESLDGWLPEVGDVVHKRYFEGWTGPVFAIDGNTATVRWFPDTATSTVEIRQLRPKGFQFQGREGEKQSRRRR